MNGNVPLTITITDALSPYSNHSVLLWDILLVFAFSPVVIWLTSSFVSSPAWAPASWHAHLSRAASGAFDAPTSLIRSLWRVGRVASQSKAAAQRGGPPQNLSRKAAPNLVSRCQCLLMEATLGRLPRRTPKRSRRRRYLGRRGCWRKRSSGKRAQSQKR